MSLCKGCKKPAVHLCMVWWYSVVVSPVIIFLYHRICDSISIATIRNPGKSVNWLLLLIISLPLCQTSCPLRTVHWIRPKNVVLHCPTFQTVASPMITQHYWFMTHFDIETQNVSGQGYLIGYLAAWEGPQLLLAKVKDASGRIGIFSYSFWPAILWHHKLSVFDLRSIYLLIRNLPFIIIYSLPPPNVYTKFANATLMS